MLWYERKRNGKKRERNEMNPNEKDRTEPNTQWAETVGRHGGAKQWGATVGEQEQIRAFFFLVTRRRRSIDNSSHTTMPVLNGP